MFSNLNENTRARSISKHQESRLVNSFTNRLLVLFLAIYGLMITSP